MSLFDFVPFGPEDVKAVANGKASTGQIIAILTSQTCGEPCWHAHEDICRCSCGGKNHGCLRTADGVQPVRMAKIDGVPYKLAGVGLGCDIRPEASKINAAAGYRSVDRPSLVIDSMGLGPVADFPAELAKARAEGKQAWVSQYRYTWSETDETAPARVKYATPAQVAKWPELAAYRDKVRPCLLWVRETMPDRPSTLVLDKETGLPLADQNPVITGNGNLV